MNHFAFTDFAPAIMNDADAKARDIRAQHELDARERTAEQRQKVRGGFTPMQMAWAAQHDWYVAKAKHNGKDGVLVNDEIVKDGVEAVAQVEFYDFQDLRDWAGY